MSLLSEKISTVTQSVSSLHANVLFSNESALVPDPTVAAIIGGALSFAPPGNITLDEQGQTLRIQNAALTVVSNNMQVSGTCDSDGTVTNTINIPDSTNENYHSLTFESGLLTNYETRDGFVITIVTTAPGETLHCH